MVIDHLQVVGWSSKYERDCYWTPIRIPNRSPDFWVNWPWHRCFSTWQSNVQNRNPHPMRLHLENVPSPKWPWKKNWFHDSTVGFFLCEFYWFFMGAFFWIYTSPTQGGREHSHDLPGFAMAISCFRYWYHCVISCFTFSKGCKLGGFPCETTIWGDLGWGRCEFPETMHYFSGNPLKRKHKVCCLFDSPKTDKFMKFSLWMYFPYNPWGRKGIFTDPWMVDVFGKSRSIFQPHGSYGFLFVRKRSGPGNSLRPF